MQINIDPKLIKATKRMQKIRIAHIIAAKNNIKPKIQSSQIEVTEIKRIKHIDPKTEARNSRITAKIKIKRIEDRAIIKKYHITNKIN